MAGMWGEELEIIDFVQGKGKGMWGDELEIIDFVKNDAPTFAFLLTLITGLTTSRKRPN